MNFMSQLQQSGSLVTDNHGITLISDYVPNSSQCGNQLSIVGKVGSKMASSSLHNSDGILTLESIRGGSFGILKYQSMSPLLHLGKSVPFGSIEVEGFQSALNILVELCIFSSALVPLVLSKFLVEHVTGQFGFLIFMAHYWMETLISHSSQHVGRYSSLGS